MKLWQKDASLDKEVESFTVGNDYLLDQALVKYDCLASIAHAKMLGMIGVLSKQEVKDIVAELNRIQALEQAGEFKILPDQEDCHTAIELHLTRELGELGKKIHTGRSRNDQVLTALRLLYRDQLQACRSAADKLVAALKQLAGRYPRVSFPGYTHTRKAMPSSIPQWAGAYRDALGDDLKLLATTDRISDQSPLGSGAGFGVPIKVDRQLTAKLLQFKKVQKNPVYVQLSRGKFEGIILNALAQIMLDLNRMATDLIFFSLPENGYLELPSEFCTGSSIMPQKKNPDVLELVRGNYHLVSACEAQIRATVANQISGYHRDLQLTKEPTLKGFATTLASLSIMALVTANLVVNKQNCARGLTPDIFATERAYELVKRGVSFRDAYQTVARDSR